MGEFEAVGDAVTGGLVGRAVEPNTGVGDDGHTHETACLNCGARLAGEYCHDCGQHAHVHRTLTAFLHDFLHGVLHFEGKVWRTLPLLAWRPGELTRRYIEGHRARFVSPIALFLFSVFLMFAMASATGGFDVGPNRGMQQNFSEAADDARGELAKLEAQRRQIAAADGRTSAIDAKIKESREALAAIEAMKAGGITAAPVEITAPTWLRASLERARDNPSLLFYKLKTNAYKFSWLIIPLSVPFMWLLFPFSRRFRLYDHVVFVTYSLSFMTLLLVAGMIFGTIGLGGLAGVLALLVPFHMFRQLKGAYALSTAGALWRTVLLTWFALVVAVLFALLLVGAGLFN